MRVKRRQSLSYLLLAIYGGISVLGDGLHLLVHEEGHHHGLQIVCRDAHHHTSADHGDCHDPGCATSDADYCQSTADSIVAAADCAADSHICEVCAFLIQALSPVVEVAAPVDWQPLTAVAAIRPLPIYSPTSFGPHAPRGPPHFVA